MWSSPKVTPLLKLSPAESPVLWYGGRTDLVFCVLFQMLRFRKSRHRLFFYPKGKVKKIRKDLWDYLLSSGGRLWKGKVLAPIVTRNLASHFSKDHPESSSFLLSNFKPRFTNFPRKSFTRVKWSFAHWKVKLWLLIKIKFQESYFIKTCWDMKFVSSRN